MKFLIIGDLHGNKPNIYFKNFDTIIAPGDFCSDKGIREFISVSYKEFLKNPYDYRDWWEIAGKVNAKKIIKKSLLDGRKILEFLNSFKVPIYIVPGNWDWTMGWGHEKWSYLNKNFFKEILIKNLKNIKNIHKKVLNTKYHVFVGYGICSGPELYKYRDYERIFKRKDIEKNKKMYGKLIKKYSGLFKKAEKKNKPIIFLNHNVPFNTKIDMITDKKSPRYGYHYGSLLTKRMIEKYQPLISIGGHMHEHFGKIKIGKTVCINAGFGSYVNALLEIDGNKIKKLEFYQGKKVYKKILGK